LAGIRHPWNTNFEWARAAADPQLLTCDDVARFHEDDLLVVGEYPVGQGAVLFS